MPAGVALRLRYMDLVFTRPDGSPLHPADVTDEFARLISLAGLPPITLHGLRHGAATLALEAGVDIKVIQQWLTMLRGSWRG
ncbi:tyrosine-type recombinase/integrase [Amycolatopsis sp. NBC_00348]|uniref:tyrosine-type recombinase/integrase n=1 Tax=Amycolatopsis sp. NBC_00348 TaxID=2975956 RepID=UPI002E25FF16